MKKFASKAMAAVIMFAMVLSVGLFNLSSVSAADDGIKVHLYNTLEWENVYVHSWSADSNAPEKTPMTPSESENWFEFTFDGAMGTDFEFLMYNGEWQGFNQTENITVTSADELYYVVQPELGEGGMSPSAKVIAYASEEEAKNAGYPEPAAETQPAATTEATIAETTAATAAATVEKAAGVTSKLYYKNSDTWSKAYIWAWTMEYTDQMTASAWPGDEMSDLGNGWMLYEVEASEDYAVLFNDGDAVQTADCPELKAGKAYWFAAGEGTVENDTGIGGGSAVVVYEEAQAGWPEGPALSAAPVKDEKDNKIIWYAAIGAVVVIAAAAGGLLIAKRSKAKK